jgi:hypothetical protein
MKKAKDVLELAEYTAVFHLASFIDLDINCGKANNSTLLRYI